MKILGREVFVFARNRQKSKDNKKPTAPVLEYPIGGQTQGFSNYTNVQGTQALSYELIDDLYDKTIMNRVINKVAGDCTRMNYSVNYISLDGKKDEELEKLGMQIDVRVTRSVLRSVFRDMLKYGTAFLYVQYGPDGLPIQMYTIDPTYVTPIIENGQLIGWKYQATGTEQQLKPEELIAFAYDPKTGEIFGKSIFGPIMQVLELLLNSELNTAILIDRYALPIIQWMLDSGLEGVKTDPKDILAFMKMMKDQLAVGADIGTDSGVKAEVIGTDSNLIDFIPIVQNLKETLGITCGVPLQLIGMKGDNLSVTTRQMQAYLDFVRDLQETIGDILIERIYKPFLVLQGKEQLIDYKEITINFPTQAVEEGSKAIQWVAPAVNLGLISREEGRNALGLKGQPVDIENIETPEIQPEVKRPGAAKPNDPNEPQSTEKNPDGDPANRSHK